MIDLDGKTYERLEPDEMENDRLRLLDVAEARGWHVYFERSSRGNGWHVYVFTEDLMPLDQMARDLRGWAQAAMIHNATAVETYPANGNASGKWQIMPYAGAATDEHWLGDTHLETPSGSPIPYDELPEWIKRTPNKLLESLVAPQRPLSTSHS